MLNQSSRSLTLLTIGLSVAVGTIALPRSVNAYTLGPAEGYNLFVLGNVTQDTIHSQGKVAVGGNIIAVGGNITSSVSYGIGDRVPLGNNLVVGGNINLGTNGQVNGKAIYGGATASVNATQGVMPGTPIDFSAARNSLVNLSDQFRGLTVNGVVSAPANSGLITLSGQRSDYNVFNLASSQLTNTVRYQIQAPSTAQIIINILGDNVTLGNGNFAFEVSGAQFSRVLYNFNATQITAQNIEFQGNILAPNAVFNADSGQIRGTAIFGTVQEIPGVNGTFEYNSPSGSFGDGSSNNSVPTPALLPGILAIAGRMWQRSRKTGV
jgi:choice-of-anchor A domain-containing protein